MRMCRTAVVALALLAGSVAAPAQAQTCSVTGQNTFVRDALQQYYLWYRDLPDTDPARFASPEAYLAAVRFRPLDTTFSYITSRAADEAFYSDSQFIGLGLSTTVTGSELRVLQVFDDSPAQAAGLERGARIDAIDGRAVSDLIVSGGIDSAFGPAQIGLEVRLDFRRRDGERRVVSAQKRAVTIPTVSLTKVFEVDGRKVGYLFFRNFVRPSVAALDEAFAALREAGVRELVLDLRYNGGGLVDVAVHLASLVGGPALRDQVFAQSQHNDRNRRLDSTLRFTNPDAALGLERLVVIATRSSASASELVINGLRPFLPVLIVGDRTYGKPVGQYGLTFCDKVLAPVAFAMVNADGAGGYFDGLAADCPAGDDIEHDLGSAQEASLAVALQAAVTGTCPATLGTARARAGAESSTRRVVGWQSLVNAY